MKEIVLSKRSVIFLSAAAIALGACTDSEKPQAINQPSFEPNPTPSKIIYTEATPFSELLAQETPQIQPVPTPPPDDFSR